MQMKIRLDGDLAGPLRKHGDRINARTLSRAVHAGLMPIVNRGKQNAPVKSGNLRRSIHGEVTSATNTHAEGMAGTDVEYALRQELGFDGPDALGRVYHQPGSHYMQRAAEDGREEAQSEVSATLRQILMGAGSAG